MIRKDVKLGFAIGGVLLAVLVVYVLVGTGNDERGRNGGDAPIVTEDTSQATRSGNPSPPAQHDTRSQPAPTADASRGLIAPPSNESASLSSPSSPATQPAIATASREQSDANHDLWGKALNEGMLMSTTPTPEGGISARSPGNSTPGNSTSGNSASVVPQGDNTNTSADDARAKVTDALPAFGSPSTQPSGSAPDATAGTAGTGAVTTARTHVVRKGETLAKIAETAYGNANYYPHILRANPGLDPMKLKPGMTINLPAASDVKPAPSEAAAAVETARHLAAASTVVPAIDPKSQYRVASNDSLYKIAMKLYGKPDMVDKIYEANKDVIGPDRAKLKLNMLLRLPEPPTQTAAR